MPRLGFADVTSTEDIVQAALAEFSEVGIRRTSMDDVARRAGVARGTLYRRVRSKDHLIALVVEAETRRAVAGVDEVLSEHDDAGGAIEATFAFMVETVRGHALFDRLLHREPEVLLPALTINAGPFLAMYRSLIAERLQTFKDRGLIDPVDIELAAEAAARLVISVVLTPDGVANGRDPASVAAFARETLLPMLRASTP
jgi:AcrR family transcriptional regulator